MSERFREIPCPLDPANPNRHCTLDCKNHQYSLFAMEFARAALGKSPEAKIEETLDLSDPAEVVRLRASMKSMFELWGDLENCKYYPSSVITSGRDS